MKKLLLSITIATLTSFHALAQSPNERLSWIEHQRDSLLESNIAIGGFGDDVSIVAFIPLFNKWDDEIVNDFFNRYIGADLKRRGFKYVSFAHRVDPKNPNSKLVIFRKVKL